MTQLAQLIPLSKRPVRVFLSILSYLLRLGRPLVVESPTTALLAHEKSRLKFSMGFPFPLFIFVHIDPVIAAQKS